MPGGANLGSFWLPFISEQRLRPLGYSAHIFVIIFVETLQPLNHAGLET